MTTNPRKRGASSGEIRTPSRTTADSTPALAGMIESMTAGPALDEQVNRAFARRNHKLYSPGLSTTWVGAQQLIESLTRLGYYVELQVHAKRCRCRILHVLKGNAISKQLASLEAPSLPEVVAKAALLALVEVEPPSV
jgi:hypothetical protein